LSFDFTFTDEAYDEPVKYTGTVNVIVYRSVRIY